MTTAEETWNWLHPAIQDLKASAGQPWATRRKAFLDQLGLASADADPTVHELLRQLDELPDDERAALSDTDDLDTLAYDLIQIEEIAPADGGTGTAEHIPEPAEAATEGYDEAAWNQYLATNGPSWDGSEENWSAFREWFLYHAAEQGFSEPATGLLDYLQGMAVAERITTFAQYGVTIAAHSGGEAKSDEDTAAMLDELSELTSDIPGIEELSEEEITRIVTDALNQARK